MTVTVLLIAVVFLLFCAMRGILKFKTSNSDSKTTYTRELLSKNNIKYGDFFWMLEMKSNVSTQNKFNNTLIWKKSSVVFIIHKDRQHRDISKMAYSGSEMGSVGGSQMENNFREVGAGDDDMQECYQVCVCGCARVFLCVCVCVRACTCMCCFVCAKYANNMC